MPRRRLAVFELDRDALVLVMEEKIDPSGRPTVLANIDSGALRWLGRRVARRIELDRSLALAYRGAAQLAADGCLQLILIAEVMHGGNS